MYNKNKQIYYTHAIEVDYDQPPTMEMMENDDNNYIYLDY